MNSLPNNIYYKIFDRSFKASSGKYLYKNESYSKDEIIKNLKAVSADAQADEIVILNQIHGNDVYIANTGTIIGSEPLADASITAKPRLALAIQTADCVPVLITDIKGTIIGAAHCGWKSAYNDILEKLVQAISARSMYDLKAIIGPCINQKSYEIDIEFFNKFTDPNLGGNDENRIFFINSTRSNHYMFDIAGYVKLKLQKLNVEIAMHIDEDTYTNPQKYPSYRRSCHINDPYNSSILSLIMIK